ncbi:hypothetical protein HIM_00358 [Hirsutella minnesotensis 3608]|nr:hypothetical protein HIM_00358 [Hirsutella minnesotensis 3608]
MATAYKVLVPAADTGLINIRQNDETAAKLSDLLQQDLETHHVFFNEHGFHNHIVHHLFTLYGTGSGPSDLQKAYDANASYQVHAKETHSTIVDELEADFAANASRYLGQEKHYPDFLRFFQRQIERHGWQAVVADHLFADTPAARDMLGRLYGGLLHPLIQTMYGIEWRQPAIVAEGLAQAAVHANRLGNFLWKVDAAAAQIPAPQTPPPFPEVLENLRRDHEKLVSSFQWEDSNRVFDGMLARAEDEAMDVLTQIRVRPDEIDEKTAEMVHTAAYMISSAALNPPYVPRFDFFLIHHLTSVPFFLAINKLDWVTAATKARLLEWKLRMDLVQYLSCGAPNLSVDAIRKLAPSDVDAKQAADLVSRFYDVIDDGHTIKVVKGLLLAQEESRRFAGRPWIRIADDEAWLKIMATLLRSMKSQAAKPGIAALWVRLTGFPEAWKDVPKAE